MKSPRPHAAPAMENTAADDRIYTCPMHPQIRQRGPGACPICGMALEPVTVAAPGAEEERNPELEDMSRRFWVATALAVPVLAMAMSDLLPGMPLHHALGARRMVWIQLVLSTP